MLCCVDLDVGPCFLWGSPIVCLCHNPFPLGVRDPFVVVILVVVLSRWRFRVIAYFFIDCHFFAFLVVGIVIPSVWNGVVSWVVVSWVRASSLSPLVDGLLVVSMQCLLQYVFERRLHLLDVTLEHILHAKLKGGLS